MRPSGDQVRLSGRFRGLYAVLDIVVRLAHLNLLWLGGVLAGLVVGGLWPATVALVSGVDALVRRREPPTWRAFRACAVAELWRANLVGWLLAGTAFVLGFYLAAAAPVRMLQGALLVVLVLYLCGLLYVVPVWLRLRLRGKRLAAVVAYLTVARGLHTVAMVVVCACVEFLMLLVVPAALPFFGVSAPACVVVLFANLAITDLDTKDSS